MRGGWSAAQAYSFEVDADLSGCGTYVSGGMVVQEKQPKTLQFKPLRDALAAPGEFLLSDFAKMERPPLLHLAFQALDAFRAQARAPTDPPSTEPPSKHTDSPRAK